MFSFRNFMEGKGYESWQPLGTYGVTINPNQVINTQWGDNTPNNANTLRNQYDTPDASSAEIAMKPVSGKITYIKYHSNPIVVALEDGTEIKMTPYEFRRNGLHKIKIDDNGVPIGEKKWTVVLQRRPDDHGKQHTQVHSSRQESAINLRLI